MAKTKISEYSATANSNTDVASINIDENCAPSGINNAIRAVMGHLKDFQAGTNGDSFNGPVNGTVGATTPAAGAFTTLSASSTLSVTGAGTINGLTVGKGAGSVATNTAVGASVLAANTSGARNNSFGYQSLSTNTTGTDNSAIGHNAAQLNLSGSFNTALGSLALQANSTSSQSTAVGYGALSSSTVAYNTAVGAYAGAATTTGVSNTFIGQGSGTTNTTGSTNSALGRNALNGNTTGASNTAIGYLSLGSNTTASNNTAVGYQAGYSNTVAAYSTFLGYQAGYNSNYSGVNAINCFVGTQAGYAVTTGIKNTILGSYSGNQGGLDIRTASNYIVLSDGDGNPRGIFTNSGLFVANAVATINAAHTFQTTTGSSNALACINAATSIPYGVQIRYTGTDPNNTGSDYFEAYNAYSGAYRFTVRSNGGIANYSANNVNLSDRREKTNFAPAKSYLDVICAIPVQTYNYIDQNMEEDGGLTLGVVAQDVQEVAPELVMESDWSAEKDGSKMRLSIYQTDMQYALMKALQELKAEFDAYKATHP